MVYYGKKFKKNKKGYNPLERDGYYFHTEEEFNRYAQLKAMVEKEEIKDLEFHPKYRFPMKFYFEADFSYTKGNVQIVESIKKLQKADFDIMRKCLEYFFPELELRIIT